MKRTIPESLAQRQEKTRQNTLEIVKKAIISLKSQGYSIKIKDLINMTGLSRSVFSKPHIRKILVENGIVQNQTFRKNTTSTEKTHQTDLLLAEKDRRIQTLLEENKQLRYEIELLRGEVHILTHKISAQGDKIF